MAKKIAETTETELVAMENFIPETGELTTKEDILTTNEKLEVFNILALAAQLKGLRNLKIGVGISSRYLEMTEKGQEIYGIFIRYKWIAPKATLYVKLEDVPEYEREMYFEKDRQLYKKVECVEFIIDTGEAFMLGGVQFLNSFKERGIEAGQKFYAKYEGPKNRTKIFDIRTLDTVEEAEWEEVRVAQLPK
jgi:hypothetical protein